MSSAHRPQRMYNFPPPGADWWDKNEAKMLSLFWDLRWHTQRECDFVTGWRFGGVKHALLMKGWLIDTVHRGGTFFEYRLMDHYLGPPLEPRVGFYLPLIDAEPLCEGIVTDWASAVAIEAVTNHKKNRKK